MLEDRLAHGRITADKKYEAEVDIFCYQVNERQVFAVEMVFQEA